MTSLKLTLTKIYAVRKTNIATFSGQLMIVATARKESMLAELELAALAAEKMAGAFENQLIGWEPAMGGGKI
jgi:hypothetical protein